MKKTLRLIALGLCMLLGNACSAGLIEDYKALREDEEICAKQLLQDQKLLISRCIRAISHYEIGLRISKPKRVSLGYGFAGRPYTDEELEGFIKIEETILAEYTATQSIKGASPSRECYF